MLAGGKHLAPEGATAVVEDLRRRALAARDESVTLRCAVRQSFQQVVFHREQLLKLEAPLLKRARGTREGGRPEAASPVAVNRPRASSAASAVGVRLGAEDGRGSSAGRQAAFDGDARQLQLLGALASGVAHDFGNLLHGVTACLDLALADSATNEKRQQYLLEARGALRQGAALADQLTTFGSGRGERATPLVLDAAISALAPVLRHLLGRGIELELRLGAEGAEILAGSGQIEQILANLAVNARDAMPAGGVLSIATRRLDGESAATRSWVQLYVSDSGCGMDAATTARIFEPFFTTKPNGKGIGLSSVRAVIRALGGQLQVRSQPGRGTRFELSLPEPARHGSTG